MQWLVCSSNDGGPNAEGCSFCEFGGEVRSRHFPLLRQTRPDTHDWGFTNPRYDRPQLERFGNLRSCQTSQPILQRAVENLY